jgi:hypothetical protein
MSSSSDGIRTNLQRFGRVSDVRGFRCWWGGGGGGIPRKEFAGTNGTKLVKKQTVGFLGDSSGFFEVVKCPSSAEITQSSEDE